MLLTDKGRAILGMNYNATLDDLAWYLRWREETGLFSSRGKLVSILKSRAVSSRSQPITGNRSTPIR
jgi:hypothetical protein